MKDGKVPLFSKNGVLGERNSGGKGKEALKRIAHFRNCRLYKTECVV
jgi:hypothetical protein